MDNSKTESQTPKEVQTQKTAQNPPAEGKKSMKEMSKAERRELQEKQRAEKEARKAQGLPHPKKVAQNQTKGDSKSTTSAKPVSEFSFVSLFSHLKLSDEKKEATNIHSSIEKFISSASSYSSQDSNAASINMINILKSLINDYQLPDQAILNRDLPTYINTQLNHIKSAHPFTAGVSNTINFITKYIANLDPSTSAKDAIPEIIQKLEIFQVEKIESASENISIHLSKEVLDNDVILTYGNSSVVQKALEFALANGVKFTVIIIENDQQSGKILLDSLTKKGIQCTYATLSSLSYILQDATRVWLNSEALLIDGSVLSNSGTGQIALASHSQEISTLFFGESYKVWDKVLFNSTQWNVLDKATSDSALTTVKFKYDVTPYTLVSRIITESGEISADKLSLSL